MKNLVIKSSNGKSHTMINTTYEMAELHAKDVRFNPESLNFSIELANDNDTENERIRLANLDDELPSSEDETYACPNTGLVHYLDGNLK